MAKSAYLEAKEYKSRIEYKEAVELDNQNPLYLSEYSILLWEYGKLDNALIFANKSLKIRQNIFKENLNHPDLATSFNNIAIIYRDKGDLDNALKFMKKALVIREKILGSDHPYTKGSKYSLEMILKEKNNQ